MKIWIINEDNTTDPQELAFLQLIKFGFRLQLLHQTSLKHDEQVFAENAHVWIDNELANRTPADQFEVFAQFANWKQYTRADDSNNVTLYMFLVPGSDQYIGFFDTAIDRAAEWAHIALSELLPVYKDFVK